MDFAIIQSLQTLKVLKDFLVNFKVRQYVSIYMLKNFPRQN